MLFEKIKLEDDEKILRIIRRHWFVFLSRILTVIFATIVPFIILIVAANLQQTESIVKPLLSQYSNQIWFMGAVWCLINWTTLAYIWTDHYLDLWIVTDRRVISIDQKRLFSRNIGSFRLERLQDMNIEISGLIATMLNFGTVEAQTASDNDEEEFRVIGMPDPREIKSLILEAADNRMRITNRNT